MAESPGALIPVGERHVDFYGDEIIGAVLEFGDERRVYVPIRPICRYLGLDWSAQYRRIQRDEILAEAALGIAIMATAQEGGTQEMVCLPLDLLPGWLFGIDPGRVKPELREKIKRYRRDCFRALWDAFKQEIMPTTELAPRAPEPTGAQLAYNLATAVANLAREQMEFEGRVEDRFGRVREWAKTIEVRVSALEHQVSPTEPLDEGQRAELQLAVKNVGYALEQKGTIPGYPRVYSELYRRYGISSYKALPRGKFAEAMAWLREWYEELGGSDTTPVSP